MNNNSTCAHLMSHRQKTILFISGFAMVALAVFIVSAANFFVGNKEGARNANGLGVSLSSNQSPANSVGGNAFAPQNGGFSSATSQSGGAISPSLTENSSVTPTFDGSPVKSLSDVARVIAETPPISLSPSSTLGAPAPTLLALPTIPDSAVTLNPSGAATTLSYLTYFGAHAKNVVFDASKFNNVLKDKNGVVLFAPALIEKAIADNNFSEIQSSLSVQKEFVEAEINYLKAIPVTGTAIAIDKENIGIEELLNGVIDKALAVSAGSMPKTDFINYYDQFNATADSARQNLAAQSGALSVNKPSSFFDRVLVALGIGTPAKAQVASSPFGGVVLFVLPCTCNLGTSVLIGLPSPALVFVSDVFIASPLFFSYKNMTVGAWWLGLYNATLQLPCNVLPACAVTGGGPVIMAGTSPPGGI